MEGLRDRPHARLDRGPGGVQVRQADAGVVVAERRPEQAAGRDQALQLDRPAVGDRDPGLAEADDQVDLARGLPGIGRQVVDCVDVPVVEVVQHELQVAQQRRLAAQGAKKSLVRLLCEGRHLDRKRALPCAVLLKGARIVTMANGGRNNQGVIENGTIVIDGNRIATVGAAGSVTIPVGAKRIDVTWYGKAGTFCLMVATA